MNTVNPGLILHARLGEDREAALPTPRPTGTATGRPTSSRSPTSTPPIKRFGTVEELADFMVFLCSPRASYAVGGTYYVDGGMLRTI